MELFTHKSLGREIKVILLSLRPIEATKIVSVKTLVTVFPDFLLSTPSINTFILPSVDLRLGLDKLEAILTGLNILRFENPKM